MTIYAFYLFNRSGVCLYHRRWHQAVKSSKSIEHEIKLMWGLLFSMKDLVKQMSPKINDEENQPANQSTNPSTNTPNPLQSITTHDSQVHYYETLTGLRFVLVTDLAVNQTINQLIINQPASQPMKPVEALYHAYHLYDQHCLKNPLYHSCDDGLGAGTAANYRRSFNQIKQTNDPPSNQWTLDAPVFVERLNVLVESLPYFR